jgi:integrase
MAGLTVEKIRTLTAPGRYGDGGGLYLVVAPGGTKSWMQRIRIDGRRRDRGLGGYPTVSLGAARKTAVANQAAVASGQNPWAIQDGLRAQNQGIRDPGGRARASTLVPTFREAARRVHHDNSPRWRSIRHHAVWWESLERHAFPVIGNLPIDEITRRDVLDVLNPIWSTKPGAARQVRGRMRAVFNWATAYGYTESNPAGEVIKGALPTMPKFNQHYKALHYSEVQAALAVLSMERVDPFMPLATVSTRLALQFLVLTAARGNEVRFARWDEIDLDAALWTVPAEKMKAGKEHRVPLPAQALAVLAEAREKVTARFVARDAPVFPGEGWRPLGAGAFASRCQKDGILCTVHGFRSSFRDWAAEKSGARREAIELSLAHNVGNDTERAYFRSDLLDQRRELMQEWADFVAPRVGG